MRAPRFRASRGARRGRFPDSCMSMVIKAAAGRPLGQRRSSHIIERVKNPNVTFVSLRFSNETIQKPGRSFWPGSHAPAAVASPSWDIDVLPVRTITQFPLHLNRCIPMRSRVEERLAFFFGFGFENPGASPDGGWWREEGGFMQKRGFLQSRK